MDTLLQILNIEVHKIKVIEITKLLYSGLALGVSLLKNYCFRKLKI